MRLHEIHLDDTAYRFVSYCVLVVMAGVLDEPVAASKFERAARAMLDDPRHHDVISTQVMRHFRADRLR